MSLLHRWGDLVRELVLQVPMEAARCLFVLVPLSLLVWVLLLPRAQTLPPGRITRFGENLKWWAALALLLQVLIYWFFA